MTERPSMLPSAPADPFATVVTIPAPPPLPSDPEIQDHSPGQVDANWRLMRNAISAMSQAQADFLRDATNARAEFMRDLHLSLDARFEAFTRSTNEMVSGIASMLKFGQDETNSQLYRLNEIVAGLRSAVDSAIDISLSANRTVKEIKRSTIPGTGDEQAKAGPSSDSKIKL